MIKAIAVDIDGTLTDMNRVLCPESLLAIKRLFVPVILALQLPVLWLLMRLTSLPSPTP